MSDFRTRIKTSEMHFTVSERQIIDVLLKAKKPFMLTMKELANISNVSEPTIVRFYRKIGYSSYQELKVSLVQESQHDKKNTNIYEEIGENDNAVNILSKVVNQTVSALNSTNDLIDEKSFAKAGKFILECNRLFFFGQGASGIIADDAAHKFLRIGVTVISKADAHMQSIWSEQLEPNDTLFAISHSGETSSLLSIVHTAKKRGANIIVLTGYPKSSIAAKADALLLTQAKETEHRSDAMTSRIVQLAIIDSLYVHTILNSGTEGVNALNRSRLAVAKQKT